MHPLLQTILYWTTHCKDETTAKKEEQHKVAYSNGIVEHNYDIIIIY